MSTKPGDRYDERRLRDDFRRLWDTGFLDDLQVEARDGPSGQDRDLQGERAEARPDRRLSGAARPSPPRPSRTSSRSESRALKIDTFYDPAKARKVEDVIKEMLEAKGHPFAKVKHEAKTIGGAGQQVSFIDRRRAQGQGQDRSTFDGNAVFPDAHPPRPDEEDQGQRASST